jgi:hypothetical protein
VKREPEKHPQVVCATFLGSRVGKRADAAARFCYLDDTTPYWKSLSPGPPGLFLVSATRLCKITGRISGSALYHIQPASSSAQGEVAVTEAKRKRDHLAQANRHIAHAQKDIANQKKQIEKLERDGHEIDVAVSMLRTLEHALRAGVTKAGQRGGTQASP